MRTIWNELKSTYIFGIEDILTLRRINKEFSYSLRKEFNKSKIVYSMLKKKRSLDAWINKVVHSVINFHLFWRLDIDGIHKINFHQTYSSNDVFSTVYPICTYCYQRHINCASFFSLGEKFIKSYPFLQFFCRECSPSFTGVDFHEFHHFPSNTYFSDFRRTGDILFQRA